MAEHEDAVDFAGEPDGFDRLWTPHRMVYIGGQDKPADGSEQACPFCAAPEKSDADGLVVAAGDSFALAAGQGARIAASKPLRRRAPTAPRPVMCAMRR